MTDRKAQVEIIVFKIINGEIFFLLLKRNEQKGGFWQPVTGGARYQESLIQAVRRELKEETGINNPLRIIEGVYYFEFNTKEYGLLKEYVFGVEVTAAVKIKISSEHTEMRWCALNDSLIFLKHENNKIAFKKLYSLLTG